MVLKRVPGITNGLEVVPKKSSSVVTEPLLRFLIWSQLVHNWSCKLVTLPGNLNQYALMQMKLCQADQRLLNIQH